MHLLPPLPLSLPPPPPPPPPPLSLSPLTSNVNSGNDCSNVSSFISNMSVKCFPTEGFNNTRSSRVGVLITTNTTCVLWGQQQLIQY